MKFKIKKYIIKIVIILAIIIGISFLNIHAAESITGLGDLVSNEIEATSNNVDKISAHEDLMEVVNEKGKSILHIFKIALQGILLIYIIYIGIQMVISMGTDEDKLSKGKSQLRYSLVAIMFINIPGTLYDVIKGDTGQIITNRSTSESSTGTNILINNTDQSGGLGWLLNNITSFIEVIIFGLAVFTIIMHGIKIMTSRGREEEVTKSKTKILYSLIAGIFVGFIEGWRRLAMSTDLAQGGALFGNMTQVALVFAGPVAFFFLTLAGYYYITANGEEEKVKKAKNIVVNTLIGVILLGAMFTLLNDLAFFN